MKTKKALITGITGQDGSYLAEFLLKKEYEVYGLVRRLSTPNMGHIQHLLDSNKIHLIGGDLGDQSSIISALRICEPDEIYNFAAQSFVGESWGQGELTSNISGVGALRVFEAVRQTNRKIKIYQASSSEMYGNSPAPQNEDTIMKPRSPYGVAKLFAHHMARVYRESYNMFISCGICFNHESPRRGIEFVTQRIANEVANIKLGYSNELKLGNLNAKRDWGYAPDYIEGMWKMVQEDESDDYVLATCKSHSVQEFTKLAFETAGLNYLDYVKTDNSLVRPAEIFELRGDISKAYKQLNWKPKTDFNSLVKIMVDAQLKNKQHKN